MKFAGNHRFARRSVAVVLTVLGIVAVGPGCRSMPKRLRLPRRAPKPPLLGAREVVPAPYLEPVEPTAAQAGSMPSPVEALIPAVEPVVEPAPLIEEPPAPATIELPPAVDSEQLTYTIKKRDTLWEIARMYGVTHQELMAENGIAPNQAKKLKVGTVLKIPRGGRFVPPDKRPKIKPKKTSAKAKTVGKAAFPPGGKYSVKSGDSLWTIARRYGVSINDLRTRNSLSSDVLQVGQVLVLPSGAKAAPKAKAAPAPVKLPEPVKTDPIIPEPTTDVAPVVAPDKADAPATDAAPAPAAIHEPLPAPSLTFPKTLEHTVIQGETLESIADMYDAKVDEIKAANPTVKGNDDLRVNMKIVVPYH